MSKLILTLTLAAVAVTAMPAPATAQDCTRGYETCLNDTFDLSGFAQRLADIECLAGYVGCVRRMI